MLALHEVDQIATKAVSAALQGVQLSGVHGELATDSDGHAALLIRVVVKSDKDIEAMADSALDAIVQIQRDLAGAGDERFTIVEFATEDEMVPNGSP